MDSISPEQTKRARMALELLEPTCRCNSKGPVRYHNHIPGCLVVAALRALGGVPTAPEGKS